MQRLIIVLIFWLPVCASAQWPFQEGEIVLNRIKSPHQEDSTSLYTLSTGLDGSDSLSVIFLLPVERQKERYRYGVGIREVKELLDSNLLSRHILFIQPEFSRIPWYANHPSNPEVAQEKYLAGLIEDMRRQMDFSTERVYLLGFSKSGWGSMSFTLNYPELVDGIFIWDAPLATGYQKAWGMEQVFLQKPHFEENYQLTKRLARNAQKLRGKILVVGGYDFFATSCREVLEQLEQLGVAYIHDSDLNYPHEWNKTWIYGLLRHRKGLTKSL